MKRALHRSRAVLLCAALCSAVAQPAVAVAQSGNSAASAAAQLELSAPAVELGGAVQVQLTASGSDTAPNNPRLTAPPGFVVVGPSVGTSQQISITGAGFRRSIGITATWRLNATKLGEFTIGPGVVTVDGKQIRSNAVTLRVVPAGSLPAPQRQRRRINSPFDDDFFQNFGRPGRSLFDDLLGVDEPPQQPAAPDEYQLATAPDEAAFLRATVSPEHAVVGQQVTFRVYAYSAAGRFNENNPREARKPDFYAVPLLDPSKPQRFYQVNIGGRDYLATKLREVALFPLKSGELEISPMTISFYGSRFVTAAHPEGLERSSSSLKVIVSEPPAQGRPPGFESGNIGTFNLTAVTSPRQVAQGDSISVVATVEGRGNLPARLSTPDQHDVEWLEPSIRDNTGPDEAGTFGGTRTFTYVVKLDKPGDVDLGALKLDFFNPQTNKYATASAPLGRVKVTPSTAPADSPKTQERSLLDGTKPRTQPLALAPERRFLADTPWFWWALGALPLGSLLAQYVLQLWQRARSGRAERVRSPAYLAGEALKEAHLALEGGQADGEARAIAAAERALFLALDAASGLRCRGFLRSELQAALQAASLSEELAKSSVDLLAQLENTRFASTGTAGRELVDQTKRLTKRLLANAA